jgi:hypothetical protein
MRVEVDQERVAIEKTLLQTITMNKAVDIHQLLDEVDKRNGWQPDFKIKLALLNLMGSGRVKLDAER